MAKGVVLTPKRKLTFIADPQELETIVKHITENTITMIGTGAVSNKGKFDWELKIPCGIDKYPGGHGA